MRFKDQFNFVRQNMKKNRSRIFMTVLATAMGCAFLIVLASVGFGLHKSVVTEVTERRAVTEISVHGKQGDDDIYYSITDEDIEYFESLEDVKAVTRRKSIPYHTEVVVDEFKGYTNSIVAHMPSELKSGFELSAGRLPEKENEIIVGYNFIEQSLRPSDLSEDTNPYDENGNLKDDYKYNGDLIGKDVIMLVYTSDETGNRQELSFPLTIVGIGAEPTRNWMHDINVYISEEKYIEINGAIFEKDTLEDDRPYNEVNIYAKNLGAVEDLTEQLEEKGYGVWSVVSELKEINIMFTIVKVGLLFIGTIAILIASIGIYNTMTMAVTERAPDIGIMKAIGANPKTIKNIFLIESSYIGLLGAIFGTIIAYVISFVVNFGLPFVIKSAFGATPPEELMFSYIPWTLPMICIVICLSVTILSGLRPAKRATKVDVLKAMRREI
ncbi:metabolite permease [Lottiidibacillus patelloidae]|uniref:Metabolite permease n=1 Tax=Lottiidibacillus patelloidae TaxID=2670334 RepID=A0A263BRE5_9BACI|nr:FtsX-like permease family protein [Lottiidibacillus patelloidae]OZM56270.1 metabolite permease [Lottiidibacillus patelloidae]